MPAGWSEFFKELLLGQRFGPEKLGTKRLPQGFIALDRSHKLKLPFLSRL
jgi:hypothetical protein